MTDQKNPAAIHKAHLALREAFRDFIDQLDPELMLAMQEARELMAANADMKERLRQWECLWKVAGPPMGRLAESKCRDGDSDAARRAIAAHQYMQETTDAE